MRKIADENFYKVNGGWDYDEEDNMFWLNEYEKADLIARGYEPIEYEIDGDQILCEVLAVSDDGEVEIRTPVTNEQMKIILPYEYDSNGRRYVVDFVEGSTKYAHYID